MSDNKLGSTAQLQIPMFNKTLDAKVDTGATTCCLHGINISVKNNSVSFVNPELSSNVITMPLASMADVHSADHGVDQRPVVHLNVNINGVTLENIEFNINDRSEMDTKILLGQNLLKRGNFVVDVAEAEDVIPTEPTVIAPGPTPAYDQLMPTPLSLRFDDSRQVFVAEFTIECLQSLIQKHGK